METPESQSKRILIVEDEPSICEICQQVLIGEGFEVDTAENGRVAISMIPWKIYDLCLIDIRMPEVNGKEFFKWLQQNHPHLAKKVIFTTGDVIGGDIKNLIEDADVPILPKPFTPSELENIVKKAFTKAESLS